MSVRGRCLDEGRHGPAFVSDCGICYPERASWLDLIKFNLRQQKPGELIPLGFSWQWFHGLMLRWRSPNHKLFLWLKTDKWPWVIVSHSRNSDYVANKAI